MQRVLVLTAVVASAVGALTAGTIQTEIGGTNGLTGSYLTNGGTTPANDSGFTDGNYDGTLFSGALGVNFQPYSTYSTTGANAGTLTDSTHGVTFAMINDGCGGGSGACTGTTQSNNYYNASGLGSTLTIPIGIFDVSDVYTMIQNNYGQRRTNNTTVTLDFSGTATGAPTETLIVNLTNADSTLPSSTGEIDSSVTCTNPGTSLNCANVARGGLAPSTNISTSGSGSALLPSITVNTNALIGSSTPGATYDTVVGGSSVYSGSTAGFVNLSDQGFILGSAFSDLFLVDVKVTENNGNPGVSSTDISAVTVDSFASGSAIPEPSTLLLVIAGLLTAAMMRMRKRSV